MIKKIIFIIMIIWFILLLINEFGIGIIESLTACIHMSMPIVIMLIGIFLMLGSLFK